VQRDEGGDLGSSASSGEVRASVPADRWRAGTVESQTPTQPGARRLSRRTLLQVTATNAAAISLPPAVARAASSQAARSVRRDHAKGRLFRQLDAKIEAAMHAYGIPGVAVGVLHRGKVYIKGYGVTNVDYPGPVDGDTVFRIASTTKTFTGTTVMRLIDRGELDLDARVRSYLPDFATADETAAAQVTVRQLLNHSAGWLGDFFQDTGPGDDALARYVAGMTRLPQLTSPGSVFAYNNAALCLAGRVIEVVTGSTYEAAVRKLLLDPLGLAHSRFFSDEIVGFNVAAAHKLVKDKPVVDTSFWQLPRSNAPTGGLISSARDQLRYARFHLGDGRAPNGARLLTRRSLAQMRSHPGPGGTLIVELDGMGVTWMLRPSAQGLQIVQHGGTGPGQCSGFIMVPRRGFALTLLTNSDGGGRLRNELFTDDWALRRFARVSNLPAEPHALGRREIAQYEGGYVAQQINERGALEDTLVELRGRKGQLHGTLTTSGTTEHLGLAFYRKDHVLDLDRAGRPIGTRANFVRGADGKVTWWRNHGRLFRRQQ
jgi:CubicO group peptidase (beta-lactamase class C family)